MNTANKLTILRMVLVPVYIVLMLVSGGKLVTLALVVFILASLTDFLDGYIARHCDQVTDFGKFMDPLADKLLVTSAILLFVQFGQMPAWAAIVIIAREFAISGLRMVAASGGKVIAAAWSGKIKTASSLVAICVMMTSVHSFALVGDFTVDGLCTAVMVITTVVSGIEYFVKNGKVLTVKS